MLTLLRSSTFLDSLTFRTVILVGTFDYSRAIFLGPRVREGTLGYHVVVPLQRHTGGPDVLVDRGFVAEKMIEGKGAERRLKKEAMVRASSSRRTLADADLMRLCGSTGDRQGKDHHHGAPRLPAEHVHAHE